MSLRVFLAVVFLIANVDVSRSSECLQWSNDPKTPWQPGVQGGKPQGVCRVVSLDSVPMGVEVGKLSAQKCFFTVPEWHGSGQNGTASPGEYQVASVLPGCTMNWVQGGVREHVPSTNLTVVGFRSDGTSYGLCLMEGGEGAGSSIVGKLFLGGSRKGECCWSAGYKEHCSTTGYTYSTYTPPPPPPNPPPVPPEPTPPALEPHAPIISARLSYGAQASTMGLTFSTPNNTASSYTPIVRWTDSTGKTSEASCTTSKDRTCYTQSPKMHYCQMTQLQPSTIYNYSFGDILVGMTQQPFKFRSAPEVGDTDPQTVIVYGDMGLDYSEDTRVMLALWAEQDMFDWSIHNGDISYADNRIGIRNGTVYNDWMDVFYANVSKYASLKPYMTSPGNHEVPCNYLEYEARSRMMPYQDSGSNDVQYYSYTIGRIHVVALSGEGGRLSELNGTQIKWLESDLKQAAKARDEGKIDWIITHVHYPNIPTGYCSSMMSYCCADGNVGLREEIEGTERYKSLEAGKSCVDSFMTEVNKYVEDMFVKYHVDIHITAHQHVYERTTPVYRYKAYGNNSQAFPANHTGDVFVSPKYPINVNNGCPGNVELQDSWMPRPSWSIGRRLNSDGSGGTARTNWKDFGVLRMTTAPSERSILVEYVTSNNQTTVDKFKVYMHATSTVQ